MENNRLQAITGQGIRTPAYVMDEKLIEKNLEILKKVKERTGCKVFLALKAYSMFSTFPLISKYLDGVCASGVNESRLGYEYFKKEVHTFGAAYTKEDIDNLLKYSDTIIFNSFYQLEKYGQKVKKAGLGVGVRVNPEDSGSPAKLYDPCAKFSRLGITAKNFKGHDLSLVDGLHFHALCQQNSYALEKVLDRFEKDFGAYIKNMKWVNFGGGHHITGKDYNLDLLVNLINGFKDKYGVQVHLEPGEAVVLNAGWLVTTVLDIIENEMQIAILDASAEAHMPDVLAMPYRPDIIGAGKKKEKKYTYRLGGPSCLAGDIIGDYSFDKPLKRGDKLVFTDMALYSFVKNTTFNGINLPDLALLTKEGKYKVIKRFGYKDFKSRLS